ncbi:protein-disulfide reductase DsbD [Paraburkholderia sp. NMBU_R16]|uniref:protein-disulfide reductase DsbD n=1 Tax=Paraburkholderia sp. NMBU_R16 TaxID=2698676 RepID=UPI00156308DF|nr:protein-disulfide reductase DsbD [Paraburkholderia sp. NMBU_R16]NRO96369.1 protein-disulfide reductase DsbD [Paraburkholderia sp. NMBU_R16]
MFRSPGAHARSLARFLFLIPLALAACLMASFGTSVHADDFLDPSAAFRFSASEVPGAVDVRFQIADGYYLYRERFAFAVKSGTATLGEPQLPAGHVKFDQTFQKNVETYRQSVVVHVPVKAASGPFELAVTSQGCADAGICYPPDTHVYRVSGAALQSGAPGAGTTVAPAPVGTAGNGGSSSWYDRLTSADYADSLLQGGGFAATVGLYFLAGLVLSLLPCSYPMIPILSAIIIGEGHRVTHARGFALSLSYVIGMALVYTALGIAAALVGQSLGAWLQNPWVLGAFALLLTLFALSLIAGLDIALPQRWHDRISETSNRRPGGKLAAVAAMGALSALVVGACMTAPLFAVLAFIAHTGNALLGGVALFSMGIGLGVPLLIVGLGAGALLPRAGGWMEGIKVFFGVVLLAAALWIVWPVLPATAQMLLGALWLLFAAATLGLFSPHASAVSIWRRLGRGIGAAFAIWAAALIVGLAAGSTDPLRPLAVLAARVGASAAATEQPLDRSFQAVRSSAELDRSIKAAGRPAMLDFYADWCVSCKEMERFTFADPRVRARLAQLQLLRADVTANNADDQALLKRFSLFGPPGIIFFDAGGKEVLRVVGYESADKFLRSLDRAFPVSGSSVALTIR